MRFQWHEAKRLSNIKKHGFDFLDVGTVFSNSPAVFTAKTVSGEDRWIAIGLLGDACVTIVFTQRDDIIRIISMRGARRGERQRLSDIHS
jgi:uncharacterized DUF497 family protein